MIDIEEFKRGLRLRRLFLEERGVFLGEEVGGKKRRKGDVEKHALTVVVELEIEEDFDLFFFAD